MVYPTPSSSVTYQWNTAGCYRKARFTDNKSQCFPSGQTSRRITGSDLIAEDAGTITCTAKINNISYTSEPFTLRISGEQLVYYVIKLYITLRGPIIEQGYKSEIQKNKKIQKAKNLYP